MKESISYSFLLNIVILFIFTCFAILMGILSYYKAFRANTIISETIEKYEGYNCVSAEEIARKLNGIGYNTPFNVSCNGKGDYCMTDVNQNYAIISYNLDIPEQNSGNNIVYRNSDAYRYSDEYSKEKFKIMNSTYKCDSNGCITNKHYQYGIYTYMYVELPVVSNLIRIPFFSKTSIMYEFRNFYVENDVTEGTPTTRYIDVQASYDNLFSKEYKDGEILVNDEYKNKCILSYSNGGASKELKSGETNSAEAKCTEISARQALASAALRAYALASTENLTQEQLYQAAAMVITKNPQLDYRTRAITLGYTDRLNNKEKGFSNFSGSSTNIQKGTAQRQFCGFIMDYSKIN